MSRRRRRRRRPPKFDVTPFNEHEQPSGEDRVIDASCIARESSSNHSLNGDVCVSSLTPPSPKFFSSSSKWQFFRRSRKKKQNHSAGRNQNVVTDMLDQYEEKVKACEEAQDSARAELLYEDLKQQLKHIKLWLKRLMDVRQDKADVHRENHQHLKPVTTSISDVPIIQSVTSTEAEDEIHILKEPCGDRTFQPTIRLQEDDQCEQAEPIEIECEVDVEDDELLSSGNDAQPDSGLVGCSDGEGDDNPSGVVDALKSSKVSSREARIKVLTEDVKKLKEHSREQSQQILKYKQQAEVSTYMEEQLKSKDQINHDLKEECRQKHEELVNARRNLEQQIQMNKELQNEMAALNAQLTVYKTDFDQERQDRAEAHSRMAEMEKKGAHIKGQIETEREAYHREHQDLKQNYQIAHSQLEHHQQALSAVEEVNENLRQEIQAKASQVKQYAKENDRLKRELEQGRSKIASPDATSGVKHLEDLYRTALDDNQNLSEENSRHQDRIEELEREIEHLRRISQSALSPVHTPYEPKAVDMNLTGQPLYAEEALHREPYACTPVSPLTGQKQSQLLPPHQAVHLMPDEVEADGASPHSKEALLYPRKHTPANLAFSPPEQEFIAPKQMRPDQQEKVLAPSNLPANHHAPFGYNPLHVVTPLPQPLTPHHQPQAQPIPKPMIQHDMPVSAAPHSDQPYNSLGRLISGAHGGGDQASLHNSAEHYREVEDYRQLEDSTAQYENPLQKELDDEIHQQAAEVIQEVGGGRREIKTDNQRPFDPNLVCPMCRRQFRIGEIQKFKKHVNTCTGTDDD